MTALSSKSNANSVIRQNLGGGIISLTLNCPKSFNALSRNMMNELQHHLDILSNDTKVRVIILAGSGKAFCAGHNLTEILNEPKEAEIRELFNQCSKLMLTLTKLPQPTIARVQGVATAAGCQLVAQCDLAIASTDSSFGTSGIGIGFFCGTPSVAVTRNLTRKKAMELLLTGDFIDSKEAERYGLINKSVAVEELDREVNSLAVKLAKKLPEALSMGKKLFYTQIEKGMEAAYLEATEFMVANLKIKSSRDGIRAFMEKKNMPDWPDRE